MPLKHINAVEAKTLVDQGAMLVDIREDHEYDDENIPAARNAPLSRIAGMEISGAPAVVFHCKSGARTRMNAAALAACTDAEVYILDGGIEAWKAAGFPVRRSQSTACRSSKYATGFARRKPREKRSTARFKPLSGRLGIDAAQDMPLTKISTVCLIQPSRSRSDRPEVRRNKPPMRAEVKTSAKAMVFKSARTTPLFWHCAR